MVPPPFASVKSTVSGVFVHAPLIITIRSCDPIRLLIGLPDRTTLARPFCHPLTELAFLGKFGGGLRRFLRMTGSMTSPQRAQCQAVISI
ncbi:MAG: hypothetical protein DCC63_07200 [Nitrospira sp.]|nr:MAG: hypothetical protein DCC63_07200 [Nitrospira sp.]